MNDKDLVLIDTSVWIMALRGTDQQAVTAVDELLAERRAVTCHIVILELLRGSRTNREFNQLYEDLGALPVVPIKDSTWINAAKTGFHLKKEGFTIPTIDLIIASVAIDNNCALFHNDAHFEILREHAELKTSPLHS